MKHTVTLRNGVQVPALGLGTWFLGENKAARAREMESLRTGISAGMTLIDTAEMYGNGKAESLIKEVISDKKRDDLFHTIKLCYGFFQRIVSSPVIQIKIQVFHAHPLHGII